MAENSKVKVSICCATYNHEQYIAQALDSFLMQKTSFPFEVIVHDDSSTDETPRIISEYAIKHPSIIKPIFQKENKLSRGHHVHAEMIWPITSGEYIAQCEGDDYWTDPQKMQNQVLFLDNNPDYGMISSDIQLVDESGDNIPPTKMLEAQRAMFKPTVDVFDLLECNTINTLTTCIRAEILKKLAERVINENIWYAFDYWFWLQIAMDYKIYVSSQKTAAYRIHGHSVSRNSDYLTERTPRVLHSIVKSIMGRHNATAEADRTILLSVIRRLLKDRYLPTSNKLNLVGNLLRRPFLLANLSKRTRNSE